MQDGLNIKSNLLRDGYTNKDEDVILSILILLVVGRYPNYSHIISLQKRIAWLDSRS